MRSGQVLAEPGQRAFPCEFRRGFVVARGGIVVEAVAGAGIDMRFVGRAGGLQRGLVGGPGGVDVGVGLGEVQQQRHS